MKRDGNCRQRKANKARAEGLKHQDLFALLMAWIILSCVGAIDECVDNYM